MSIIQNLANKLKTPRQVQNYLRSCPYNREKNGETLSSARTALRRGSFHCFEASLAAAAILEHHGYPPLIVSIESKDLLDHVIFVFQEKNLWGAISRSREEGLNGRPAQYRSVRGLVWSYYDPYIDKSGKITAYQIVHLDDIQVDWRESKRNLWKAQNYLIDLKHKPLKSSKDRYKRVLRNYHEYGPMPRQKDWW